MLCTWVAIMAFWKAEYSWAVLNRAWEWPTVGGPMLSHGFYKLEFHLTIRTSGSSLLAGGQWTLRCWTSACFVWYPLPHALQLCANSLLPQEISCMSIIWLLARCLPHFLHIWWVSLLCIRRCLLNALEVGKFFWHILQCTACFAGWGISNGISPDVAVVKAKEEGRLPFSANSAPLLMLLRTPLLITILLGPSFTNPSGGPAGPAASDGLLTAAVGSLGDG